MRGVPMQKILQGRWLRGEGQLPSLILRPSTPKILYHVYIQTACGDIFLHGCEINVEGLGTRLQLQLALGP